MRWAWHCAASPPPPTPTRHHPHTQQAPSNFLLLHMALMMRPALPPRMGGSPAPRQPRPQPCPPLAPRGRARIRPPARTCPMRLASPLLAMASMNLRVPERAMVPRLDSSCSRDMPMPESLVRVWAGGRGGGGQGAGAGGRRGGRPAIGPPGQGGATQGPCSVAHCTARLLPCACLSWGLREAAWHLAPPLPPSSLPSLPACTLSLSAGPSLTQ